MNQYIVSPENILVREETFKKKRKKPVGNEKNMFYVKPYAP